MKQRERMKRKFKALFDYDSVIQGNTDIEHFVPSNPGWNYITVTNHPKDRHIYSPYYGKWLLFVSNAEFVRTFREIAKLAANLELTASLKASGWEEEGKDHVFCVYCPDYRDIAFVRETAQKLSNNGFINRFGYRYKDGTKAIFFKTDETTRYKSDALGESLTLFRFTDKKELFVKEFDNGKPNWQFVSNNANGQEIARSFEFHLLNISSPIDEDDY